MKPVIIFVLDLHMLHIYFTIFSLIQGIGATLQPIQISIVFAAPPCIIDMGKVWAEGDFFVCQEKCQKIRGDFFQKNFRHYVAKNKNPSADFGRRFFTPGGGGGFKPSKSPLSMSDVLHFTA